jgi:hypothetical protein
VPTLAYTLLSGAAQARVRLPPPFFSEKQVASIQAASTGTPLIQVPLTQGASIQVKTLYEDISSGEYSFEIAWVDILGKSQSEILSYADLEDPKEFLKLAKRGLNISKASVADVISQVRFTLQSGPVPVQRIASRTGWHGTQLLLPGSDITIRGQDTTAWTPKGDPQAVYEALRRFMEFGATPALVVAAASAAAPLIRLCDVHRNPVVQLAMASGMGKTSAARFGLSLWASPAYNKALYFNSTTNNGLLARLMSLQDLPCAVDDVQLHGREAVNELIYSLADGAERLRADRTGTALEASRWKGVAILTSEQSVLADAGGQGAINRSFELSDPPLGAPKGPEGKARADLLENVSRNHHGAAREALAALYADTEQVKILYAAAKQAAEAHVAPDILEQVAAIGAGAGLLARLVDGDEGVIDDVVRYLASTTAKTRGRNASAAEQGFEALEAYLQTSRLHGEEVMSGGLIVAKQFAPLAFSVNMKHPALVSLLAPFGGFERHKDAWHRAGWLQKATEGRWQFSTRLSTGQTAKLYRVVLRNAE